MNRLINFLQGYVIVDSIVALWRLQHQVGDRQVSLAEYSKYVIYYNERLDKYRLCLGGFRPMRHMLYSDMKYLIDFLNNKPESEIFNYTVRDYFDQKDTLFSMLEMEMSVGEVIEDEENSELVVIKFELKQNRDFIMRLRDSDELKVEVIKKFKKSNYLPKNVEVYEELDNILVTSEGYFVCIEKEFLSKIEDDEAEEED